MDTSSISYQLAHLHENRGPQFLQVIVFLLILATASVGLRLLSRRFLKISWQADDYAIVVALIFYGALSVSGLIAYRYGFGKHALAIGLPNVIINIKIIFAYEVLCVLCIYAIKLSILLFYRRIFPTPRFQRVVTISIVILAIIYSGFEVTFFTQCRPLSYMWDRSIKGGTCVDMILIMRVTAIINMVTDILLLLMPLPVIWRLPQISLHQKVGTSAMFCVGIFVCVTSIIRIHALGELSEIDPTWSDFSSAAWTYAEACMGIFCACLPMMRPLFTKFLWRRIRTTVNEKRSAGNGLDSESAPGTWPRAHNRSASGVSTTVNAEVHCRPSRPKIIVTSPRGGEEATGELKRWRSTGHGDKIEALEGTYRSSTPQNCRGVQSLMPLDALHVQTAVGRADSENGGVGCRHSAVMNKPSEVEVKNRESRGSSWCLPIEGIFYREDDEVEVDKRESRGPSWPLPWPLPSEGIFYQEDDEAKEAHNDNNNPRRWRSSLQYSKTVDVGGGGSSERRGAPPRNKRWLTRLSDDPVQNLLPLNAADVRKMIEWAEGSGKWGRS